MDSAVGRRRVVVQARGGQIRVVPDEREVAFPGDPIPEVARSVMFGHVVAPAPRQVGGRGAIVRSIGAREGDG